MVAASARTLLAGEAATVSRFFAGVLASVVVCWSVGEELLSAQLCREHNDANAIALGARLIGIEQAKACIAAFLATGFAGDRHIGRVEKLTHPSFAKEPA